MRASSPAAPARVAGGLAAPSGTPSKVEVPHSQPMRPMRPMPHAARLPLAAAQGPPARSGRWPLWPARRVAVEEGGPGRWPLGCRREAAAALCSALTRRSRRLWPRRHPRRAAAQRHAPAAGGAAAAPQAASRAARHRITGQWGGGAARRAEAAQAGWHRRGRRSGRGCGGSRGGRADHRAALMRCAAER